MHGDKKGLDPQMSPENQCYAKNLLPRVVAGWDRCQSTAYHLDSVGPADHVGEFEHRSLGVDLD